MTDPEDYSVNKENATDHEVGLKKRFKWLPAFKWNLVPVMVTDEHEGEI